MIVPRPVVSICTGCEGTTQGGTITEIAESPRGRLISATIKLISERGCDAVGIAEILDASGSHRNSLYRHFPDGKPQLMAAVANEAGIIFGNLLATVIAENSDPAQAVRGFISIWRNVLVATNFRVGCPVFASASAADAGVRDSAVATFTSWQCSLADAFGRAGYLTAEADSLASVTISAVEGAVVRCRAEKSPHPLDAVEAHLIRTLTDRSRRPPLLP